MRALAPVPPYATVSPGRCPGASVGGSHGSPHFPLLKGGASRDPTAPCRVGAGPPSARSPPVRGRRGTIRATPLVTPLGEGEGVGYVVVPPAGVGPHRPSQGEKPPASTSFFFFFLEAEETQGVPRGERSGGRPFPPLPCTQRARVRGCSRWEALARGHGPPRSAAIPHGEARRRAHNPRRRGEELCLGTHSLTAGFPSSAPLTPATPSPSPLSTTTLPPLLGGHPVPNEGGIHDHHPTCPPPSPERRALGPLINLLPCPPSG